MTSFRSRAPLLPLAALWVACGESPAGPPTGAPVPLTFTLTPGQADGFAVAVEDARTRLLPALGAGRAASEIEPALELLAGALASRDAAALERALRRGEAAVLRGLAVPDEEGGPGAVELEAVRLVLLEARLLVRPAP